MCIAGLIVEIRFKLYDNFTGGASGKEPGCSAEDVMRCGFNLWILNYSSILAWSIPWTEEPGGLQFRESHRAGHERSNLAHMRYLSTAE